MIELSSVEWDYTFECYCARFSNGEFALLEAKHLREAEQEAEQFVLSINDDRLFSDKYHY